MTAPNLLALTATYGKTTGTNIGTAVTVLVSNSLASAKSYKITAMYVANIDNALTGKISVDFYRSSTSIRLVDRMDIVPGDSLVVMSRDSAIYLEEGDSLRCYSDQNDLMHVTVSYETNT
jgi:hypothetical protein